MALGGVKGAEVNKSLGRARETFTVQAEKELSSRYQGNWIPGNSSPSAVAFRAPLVSAFASVVTALKPRSVQ